VSIFDLTWSCSSGPYPHGGLIDRPCWEEIAEQLRICLLNSGTVGLEAENDVGESRTLQVRSENGKHLVTMGLDINGDWTVQTYNNPAMKLSDDYVDILGDRWSAKIVCDDWDVVVNIFKDFFETGVVEHQNFG
jgi:hypothetical protein